MTTNKLNNCAVKHQKRTLSQSETFEFAHHFSFSTWCCECREMMFRGHRRWLQTDPENIFRRWDLETTRTAKTHWAQPTGCHSLLDPLAHSTPHKPPQFQLSCLRHDHNSKQENQAMEHTRTKRQNHSHLKKSGTHARTQAARTVAVVTLTMV